MAYEVPEIVQEVRKKYDEAMPHHQRFVEFFQRNEQAYLGMINLKTDAAKWRHKRHPPHAYNLIETVVANTMEQGLAVSVRPSPKVNPTMEEAQAMLTKASTVENLLRHEWRIDDMNEKQRDLALCAAIGGNGIGKEYWSQQEGPTRRMKTTHKDVVDGFGNVIASIPITEEIAENRETSHSTMEVVNPCDLILHESAKSLQPTVPGGAQHLFHRNYYSMEQLRLLQASGFIENVDQLTDTRELWTDRQNRDQKLFQINPLKDLIEVIEYWCYENGQTYCCWVGNQTVLLRKKTVNPFFHDKYPFVSMSMAPGLFSPRGIGTMELIRELQDSLWELENQRADNIEIINNFVTLVRSDLDDPESFEWYPGAFWQVDSTDQVEALHPPYQLAGLTIEAESLLRGDFQNITSAAPFASGTQTAAVQQNTATGASMVMNAAQAALAAKKWMFQRGLCKELEMRLANCQQFITKDKLVQIVGADGAVAFEQITNADIEGEYVAEIEIMGESIMRQERRAEGVQLIQVFGGLAPLFQAMGTPLNMTEMAKWVFKLWDIPDADRFFSQKSSPDVMAMGGGGGGQAPPGVPTPPGADNLGITAGSAIDASSPSAAGGISGSPMEALQRALAMGGGVANA